MQEVIFFTVCQLGEDGRLLELKYVSHVKSYLKTAMIEEKKSFNLKFNYIF